MSFTRFVIVFSVLAILAGIQARVGGASPPVRPSQSDSWAGVIATDEEFVGPFQSWRDAQRDYGAKGDGQTDDTAPLQRALDDLTFHKKACVLYLPAGTYRVTRTLQTVRKAHTDARGVAIVGEDPARTILRWDGPNAGTILRWDAWYSKFRA